MKYTENSEPPTIYRKWAGLSVIAAVMQRKCYMEWEDKIFPNMYVVLVGPSGEARKGTAMGPAQGFLRKTGIPVAAEATTREALIRFIAENQDTLITEDGIALEHCSVTIFSKELTVFLGYDNKQLMSDLTDWYDCDEEWKYRTKNMGEDIIHNIWVNLIGATTPNLISNTMPEEAIGGGLTSRMIFVYAHRRGKVIADPRKTPAQRELAEWLSIDLNRIYKIAGEFGPTEEWIGLWIDWYEQQAHNPPKFDHRFSGYLSRRGTHLRKLSMIYCAARTSDRTMTAEDFNNALATLEEVEHHMTNAFAGVAGNILYELTNRIGDFIRERGEVVGRDILLAFHVDGTKDQISDAVTTLKEMGRIEVFSPGSGRPPVFRYKG